MTPPELAALDNTQLTTMLLARGCDDTQIHYCLAYRNLDADINQVCRQLLQRPVIPWPGGLSA